MGKQSLMRSTTNGGTGAMPPADPNMPMSEREKARLAELESVVFRNFRAAYEFWAALREISRKRLYRETAPTFEKYTKLVFGIAKTQAYGYIAAADVSDLLSDALGDEVIDIQNVPYRGQVENVRYSGQTHPDIDPAPPIVINEQQARELVRLPIAIQPEVYKKAMETAVAKGKPPTAAIIRRTIRDMNLAATKDKVTQSRAKVTRKQAHMSEPFRQALDAFLEQIAVERDRHWQDTDRNTVIEALRDVTAAVESEV